MKLVCDIGLDGSQLLTHFPPNDNYCAKLKPSELSFAEKNFKDKGRSNDSMMLFGFGDGGGGPTEEMMLRMKALQTDHKLAIPCCKTTTPSAFFQRSVFYEPSTQFGTYGTIKVFVMTYFRLLICL